MIREHLDDPVPQSRDVLEARYLTLLMKRDAAVWARWLQESYQGGGSSQFEIDRTKK